MKNREIREALLNACTNKVKLCTKEYCAYGCLDQSFSEDFKIRLNQVNIIRKDGDEEVIEHRDHLVLKDDSIIDFEPYTNLN